MDRETKENLMNICLNSETVLLVDTMNWLHRFSWVHTDLGVQDSSGKRLPTGHFYGFLQFITNLQGNFKRISKGTSIILALDERDEERRKLNQCYKAGRGEHNFMYQSVPALLDFLSLLPDMYVADKTGYEADDEIHELSYQFQKLCKHNNLKKKVYILSNDKDMYQLVRDDETVPVKVIRKFGSGSGWLKEAELVNESKVRDTFSEVDPVDLVKYRAIVGDSSDNLKGYYRFRKKDASLLARCMNYDEDTKMFSLRDDADFPDSVKSLIKKDGITAVRKQVGKVFSKIYENQNIFDVNYSVMKMKHLDLTLRKIKSEKSQSEILQELKRLRMLQYLTYLGY